MIDIHLIFLLVDYFIFNEYIYLILLDISFYFFFMQLLQAHHCHLSMLHLRQKVNTFLIHHYVKNKILYVSYNSMII